MAKPDKKATHSKETSYDFSKMAAMYDKYFRTGFYEQRYPRENKKTLLTILSVLAELNKIKKGPRHILDFGCGDGRYLVPMLNHVDDEFTAYDPSETALNILTGRVDIQKNIDRVAVVDGDIEKLSRHVEEKGKVDIILLMFGVLSHVGGYQKRTQVLKQLSSFLRDENSRVILSVPNRFRRFTRVDDENVSTVNNEPGDIIYKRHYGDEELTFFYHLYTSDSLISELKEAGLNVYSLHLESFLPEKWVTNNYLIGAFDRIICNFLSVNKGYGILAVAGKNSIQQKQR